MRVSVFLALMPVLAGIAAAQPAFDVPVGLIAVDGSTPQTLYAASSITYPSAYAALYKSTDGGARWAPFYIARRAAGALRASRAGPDRRPGMRDRLHRVDPGPGGAGASQRHSAGPARRRLRSGDHDRRWVRQSRRHFGTTASGVRHAAPALPGRSSVCAKGVRIRVREGRTRRPRSAGLGGRDPGHRSAQATGDSRRYRARDRMRWRMPMHNTTIAAP